MPETGGRLEDALHEPETQSANGWALPPAAALVPGLTILGHPDVDRVGERVALTSLAAGAPVALARGQPLFALPGSASRRPLADLHISRRAIVLAPGREGGAVLLRSLDSPMPLAVGGLAVSGEREVGAAEIASGTVLVLAHRIALLLSLVDPTTENLPHFGMVGDSWRMARLRREIHRLAPLDVPVLVRGETGTGKELVARALHDSGPRRGRPFVAVNMGAIPPTLAAAELFGAARGAYTGADRARQGHFGRADGGTLFLDEVGETPPETQVLLLRALETREVQAVGSGETQAVDVRLVAATDAALEAAVTTGRFRAPLLYRLSGYEIRVPPLRERREDFGRLFFHFLGRELRTVGAAERLAPALAGARPWMPAALVGWLAARDWPGNVRQLQNVARQLAIDWHHAEEATLDPALERDLAAPGLGPGASAPRSESAEGAVQAGDLAARSAAVHDLPAVSGIAGVGGSFGGAPGAGQGPAAARPPRHAYRVVWEIPTEELRAALAANGWRIKPTAAQLGVARTSLYARLGSEPRLRRPDDDKDRAEAGVVRDGETPADRPGTARVPPPLART